MLLIFLLQIVGSFEGLAGAENETLCTSNACFTLHMKQLSFDKARQDCEDNGGYLMTLRDRNEKDELLSLLSLLRNHHSKGIRLWIGLKLKKKDCVLADETLKGFKWISGEGDSQYSNWKKDPAFTCTEERCVKANYMLSGQDQLKWTDGGCRNSASYACKFHFKGMCEPLTLSGPGKIAYTPPFSTEPQKRKMKLLPIGTYAVVYCGGLESDYVLCSDTHSWNTPGPFCDLGVQNCGTNNGGCEHFCRQDSNAVRCSCKDGYELEEDGFSCRMQNLCGPDICEHQCVMGESGFSCTCPNGFKLSENQRNCSDINECQSGTCQDHQCENTHGSYTCVCRDGYEMVDSECRDVDECVEVVCEQLCSNSDGSFSCSCTEGFALSENGRSCVDVDECLSEPCAAESMCKNTFGSFLCSIQTEMDRSTDESIDRSMDRSTDKSMDRSITESPESPHTPITPGSPTGEEYRDVVPESLTRTTVELQHQSPHTDAPQLDPVNVTDRNLTDQSIATSMTKSLNSRVIVCVLGSVIPLLLLITLTLFIILFRCGRSKKEVKKKKTTADGYCWVSSGLDPRLEKLYESILTDDL